MVQGWCSIVPGRCPMVLGSCPMVPLRCPIVPGRCLLTTVYCQRVLYCNRVPSPLNFFLKQLGPGVLTKSNTEKGGQLTDSAPMSTRTQPSNPRLRLGLLGCQLVDIGMKLNLVHFVVKVISSRTKSNQVGLSPISSQSCLATLYLTDLKLDLGRLGWT